LKSARRKRSNLQQPLLRLLKLKGYTNFHRYFNRYFGLLVYSTVFTKFIYSRLRKNLWISLEFVQQNFSCLDMQHNIALQFLQLI